MDILSPVERSKNMSAIKRADTKPEILIRKLLFSNGYRYRIQATNIPGHPDLWLKKYNTAIFVHGCFWHRHKDCKYAYTPKSRNEFWNAKFDKNQKRDEFVQNELKANNIRCLIIWECTIKKYHKKNANQIDLLNSITDFLKSDMVFSEI